MVFVPIYALRLPRQDLDVFQWVYSLRLQRNMLMHIIQVNHPHKLIIFQKWGVPVDGNSVVF